MRKKIAPQNLNGAMASGTSDACMVEFAGISITIETLEAPVTNSLPGADDDLDGETE